MVKISHQSISPPISEQSSPRAHGTPAVQAGELCSVCQRTSTITTVITCIWVIKQDVSLAPHIPKDCKVVKRQCARPCHSYQISTETTVVQVRSCFGPTTQEGSCLPLRSGHLWQETWQLFCSSYMAEVYCHLWAGASWEEESSGVPTGHSPGSSISM